jgi:hypothetical protein
VRLYTNNLGQINSLLILLSRKVRPANTLPIPPTSSRNNLNMVSTRQLSSHRLQVSTLLAKPLNFLVLTLQTNNLPTSSNNKPTDRTKHTELKVSLTQLLTSRLISPATTVGTVTTGLKVAQSLEEPYLRKIVLYLS